ncbi:lipopolysaccharide biosynthesis protein [Jannaschia seohaensis]|uniref:Membrane protein involved in the export of O-antigen and teichoic acid n=1 Tax=Jannaschia seohaensis TaxID=475081 RepID=A0A2Y9ATG0_9RHOB|nr:lipopolysaccharide biosynthesis protein [Jannaschia seohaensis]PWJ17552.1 O-antigen/teichoic acid export membrane protein [Jannaschia seohaensis]SSA47701.1 Membrane protein involved in the export of O-antigen and teichoic acid [Jannaschia seohaensis]
MVFAVTQFAILILVARLGTPQDVGALTLASAIVTPLFFLTSMGMRDAHSVDDLVSYSRADYVALRLAGGSFALLATAAIALGLYGQDGFLVYGSAIALALVKFSGAQMALNHGMFQRAERLDFTAISNAMRGGMGLAAFGLVFWYTRALPLALLCEALAWVASYVLVDRPLLGRIGARTSWAELSRAQARTVLRLAYWILPLGLSGWCLRAALAAPPLILERHAGLAAVGLFGVLAYGHSAMLMVANSLGGAVAPRLRKYYRNGRRAPFLRTVGLMSLVCGGFGAGMVAVAWLAGDPLLELVFGVDYRRGDLLTIVIFASALSVTSAPLVAAMNAGQAFRKRLLVTASGLAAAAVVSVLLIPSYGIAGAAWSMVALTATHATLYAALFVFVLRAMPPPLPKDAPDASEGR